MKGEVGLLVVSVIAHFVAASGIGHYDGYKVLRVIPQTDRQLSFLRTFVEKIQAPTGPHSLGDVWRSPSILHRPMDINVSPDIHADVIKHLKAAGMEPSVLIEDVQTLIEQQMAEYQTLAKMEQERGEFDYGIYHNMTAINAWMANLAATSDMVSLQNIAKSYEGREMNVLVIRSPGNISRPAFFFEGGIHAREWISPATVLYMTGMMIERYESYPGIKQLVDSFVWYILPVTNPDGYEYTFKGIEERLWRKTRSKNGICYGVDPNRNWNFHWAEAGTSDNPCSDIYRGPKAFSEPEVKGVSDLLLKLEDVKGFIDFHSYSQLWMSPWGYTYDKPEDFTAQDEGSVKAIQGLESQFGTKYEHGNIASTIYEASGSSADWTLGVANIEYSYAVELRDTGEKGFLLPADQIVPSGEETLSALVALAKYVAAK